MKAIKEPAGFLALFIRQQRHTCRFASTMVTNVTPMPRNKVVRVRFAPSPTGYLHLGGLRTALYNFLFAKSQGGQFVLRIEDTDQTRLVPGATQQLEQDLTWAGLVPDESPSVGGSYGPYIQSERLHLYQGQAQNLLKSGAAYRCFCSERRLEMLRKEALRQRQVPGYDNRCSHLTTEEVKEKMKSDTPHCIRLKLVPLHKPVPDLVYGNIMYEPVEMEGDPVILKRDGFPTYHLANVIDDHMMVITHVLRGVEWQISTPKHVLLYKAFGWEPPQYAHLPLIMNSDGSKLSKRQGDIQVQNYQQQGIYPMALLNYITKAGGGFSNSSLDEVYTMEQLISNFDLSRIHPHSCRLSDRLLQYNQQELLQHLARPDTREKCIQEVIQLVTTAFPDACKSGTVQLQHDHIGKILDWSQNRIHKISDLVQADLAFLWMIPSQESLSTSDIPPEFLCQVQEALTVLQNFTADQLKPQLKHIATQLGVPFSKLMKILRSVLSGLKEGPGVAEMMEILGSQTTLARIASAERILRQANKSKDRTSAI